MLDNLQVTSDTDKGPRDNAGKTIWCYSTESPSWLFVKRYGIRDKERQSDREKQIFPMSGSGVCGAGDRILTPRRCRPVRQWGRAPWIIESLRCLAGPPENPERWIVTSAAALQIKRRQGCTRGPDGSLCSFSQAK